MKTSTIASLAFAFGMLVACGGNVSLGSNAGQLQKGERCSTCSGPAQQDALVCPDGSSKGRECLARGDGTCGYDFPACAPPVPGSDGGANVGTPGTKCTTCTGPAPQDARVCPDGSSQGRECLFRNGGTCGYDFPACGGATSIDAGRGDGGSPDATSIDAGGKVYAVDLVQVGTGSATGRTECVASDVADPTKVLFTCRIVYAGLANGTATAAGIGLRSAVAFQRLISPWRITCPAGPSPIDCDPLVIDRNELLNAPFGSVAVSSAVNPVATGLLIPELWGDVVP